MAYKVAYGDQVPLLTSWEWDEHFGLRSIMYPAYLSLPLHLLRFFGIDYNILVSNSIVFMNTSLQVLGDFFLYLLAKQTIGREGAHIALVYSLLNQRINEIMGKTLSNGAEAAFSLSGLYYYSQLKPKFDKNMACMTCSITMAFLVRSSNLVGWVPLALLKLFQSRDYFVAILISGVCVTIPLFGLSVLADSLYYGKLMVPQLNFVYINVIANVAGNWFGTESPYFYIIELREFICYSEMFFKISVFGFCMFTFYDGAKIVPSIPKQNNHNILINYVLTNFIVLSIIGHKEQRFMTQIFPIFGIFWAFCWLIVFRFAAKIEKQIKLPATNLAKIIFQVLFWMYCFKEIYGASYLYN